VTIPARSNLPADLCAEFQLLRATCAESRILALRSAVADGRYGINAAAMAAKLINALYMHSLLANQSH